MPQTENSLDASAARFCHMQAERRWEIYTGLYGTDHRPEETLEAAVRRTSRGTVIRRAHRFPRERPPRGRTAAPPGRPVPSPSNWPPHAKKMSNEPPGLSRRSEEMHPPKNRRGKPGGSLLRA